MKRNLLFLLIVFAPSLFAQQINEICAANFNGLAFPGLGNPDWIEFKNNTPEPINLAGYFLTDDIEVPTKWVFPELNIGENELVLLPAKSNSANVNVINFNVKKEGCQLFLFTPEGHLVDYVELPSLQRDHSYGRIDGTWYFFETPTPNEINATATGFKGYAKTPYINRSSGAYPAGTHIVVLPQGAGQTVHYTVNGNWDNSVGINEALVLDQTMAISAVAKGDSLLTSPSIERVYFVNVLHDLPVVNINVDSLTLFDSITGMYMDGPMLQLNFHMQGLIIGRIR